MTLEEKWKTHGFQFNNSEYQFVSLVPGIIRIEIYDGVRPVIDTKISSSKFQYAWHSHKSIYRNIILNDLKLITNCYDCYMVIGQNSVKWDTCYLGLVWSKFTNTLATIYKDGTMYITP